MGMEVEMGMGTGMGHLQTLLRTPLQETLDFGRLVGFAREGGRRRRWWERVIEIY